MRASTNKVNNNITSDLQIRYEWGKIASCTPRNQAPELPGHSEGITCVCLQNCTQSKAACLYRTACLVPLRMHFFKMAFKSKHKLTTRILIRILTVNKCWKRPISCVTSNYFQWVHFSETVIPRDSGRNFFTPALQRKFRVWQIIYQREITSLQTYSDEEFSWKLFILFLHEKNPNPKVFVKVLPLFPLFQHFPEQ